MGTGSRMCTGTDPPRQKEIPCCCCCQNLRNNFGKKKRRIYVRIMFTKCLEKALQGANRINQASAARSNIAVKLQSYNSRIIQPQCCFSTNSKYSRSKKEITASPIQLSSSPIKDYKTARTFGDTKLQGKFSMTPIYIGFVLTGILTYVVFFVEGEPLDIFSTEVLEKLEKQVAQNVNVEKPIDTNSDKHVDDKSV